MSQESSGGHPFQAVLIVLCLAGGGWYFFRNYNVDGLDRISISRKFGDPLGEMGEPFTFTSSTAIDGQSEERGLSGQSEAAPVATTRGGGWFGSGLFAAIRPTEPDAEADPIISSPSDMHARRAVSDPGRSARYSNAPIRVASWALDGFGPTKLASDVARKNLVRVVRQFDVIAIQQISSLQLDLVPRMVDAINEGSLGGGAPLYDFVLGQPTGPEDRGEQLAILFNPARVRVDRTQTYTVADPDDQLTYDPLVAWFRAAEPKPNEAWTFSMVNVRIDLSRAPREVAVLNQLFKSVRDDGRGEDDVVIAGLFQADDAYLLPVVAGPNIRAAVTSTPTDIFGRHQTSNVLYDREATAEALGRGGVYDFLRVYNLSIAQAQAVSSYLPVYAEFSPLEGSPVLHQATSPATAVR